MENFATKISDSEMSIVKPAPVVEPQTVTYTLDFLKSQELSILKSMNDFVAQRQVELAEVRDLISQAEKLGIKSSVTLQAEQVEVEQTKLDSVEVIK